LGAIYYHRLFPYHLCARSVEQFDSFQVR
jgi:hypothetical protein